MTARHMRITKATKGRYCCKVLDTWLADPECPLEFDRRMNEIQMRHVSTPRGHFIVRYCPWCGAKAPKSKRPTFFAKVTHREAERVFGLVRGAKTMAEVKELIGKPDRMWRWSKSIAQNASDRERGLKPIRRQLDYNRLSRTAILCVKERTGIT